MWLSAAECVYYYQINKKIVDIVSLKRIQVFITLKYILFGFRMNKFCNVEFSLVDFPKAVDCDFTTDLDLLKSRSSFSLPMGMGKLPYTVKLYKTLRTGCKSYVSLYSSNFSFSSM